VTRPVPLEREVFKAWRVFATRWADKDAYGHINNTVFYQWFDSAVNAWLIDKRLLELEAGDPIGLVVETRCSFFVPLTFPKPVEVGIGVMHIGTSSVRYRVGIFDVGAVETAAHGEFVHVYVDRRNRRPLPLTPEWRATLETLA
jgi:acyl-CoA thioester hydrolase